MSGSPWPAGTFDIASRFGVTNVSGYVWRGLGLYLEFDAIGKGRRRRAAQWSLTHIGSGHRVCGLIGDVRTAFPVATEIAEAGDWTFDGLAGWRNQFPDCRERVREIAARHPLIVVFGKSGGAPNEEQAREIAIGRAA